MDKWPTDRMKVKVTVKSLLQFEEYNVQESLLRRLGHSNEERLALLRIMVKGVARTTRLK